MYLGEGFFTSDLWISFNDPLSQKINICYTEKELAKTEYNNICAEWKKIIDNRFLQIFFQIFIMIRNNLHKNPHHQGDERICVYYNYVVVLAKINC